MQESSILRRKCPIPIITHVGILVYNRGEPVVYHCTAIKKNIHGGNIVAMPLKEFLSIGELISTTPSNIDPNFVRLYAFNLRHQKYSALRYNCEDFISALKTGKLGSPQRKKWIRRLGLGVIGRAIYKRSNRVQ